MASILEDYINKGYGLLDLKNELKRLLKEYNKQTSRNLFIYASDFNKQRQGIDVSLMQDDFYTIQDMLRESDKETIDVYLETPGGSGETAEEVARFLHNKFKEVNFVITNTEKANELFKWLETKIKELNNKISLYYLISEFKDDFIFKI